MDQTALQHGLRLTTPMKGLPGVGARRAEWLNRLGIRTVGDLIRHLPARYEHEASEGAIADLPMDGIGSTRGTVVNTRWIPSGRQRLQATLQDHSGRVSLIWFNAAYLRDRIHPGMTLRVQGKVKVFNGYPQIVNPKWEPLEESQETPAKQERLRPIYPATEDLPSAQIERLVDQVLPEILPQLADPLPAELIKAHAMPALGDAFRMAHRPEHEDEAAAARRRLAFNELLLLQLGIVIKRHYSRTVLTAPALRWSPAIDEHIRQRFPFQLTPAQEQVVREIADDLKQTKPMNRLLQGDVGAGKTVVALYALLMAVANRKQGALMVPTELLAEQHFSSIAAMLRGSNVRLELLTGGRFTGAQRQALLSEIEEGRVDIVIGTQALLTETVRFNDLAVVVVDEQHRFGVLQRAAFRSRGAESAPPEQGGGPSQPGLSPRGPEPDGKSRPTPVKERVGKTSPHYLVMTATPIPRTLSLTIFGDLDISTIRGLPPGRQPIVTRVVDPLRADEVYQYMAKRLAQGEQAYVVVPTIDASGEESALQLKNVRAHAKLLQDKFCQGFRVAAVHGRLKPESREAIMERFRRGEIHVLVATTVIEVGVDVPNAAVMVVEHAERFGLAQLHQLRGRIGRGSGGRKSLCVFIAEPTTPEAGRRIQAIASTTDGFKIAEQDLEIRGMGDFFGTRQHGVPPLKVARIPEDMALLQLARRDAEQIVAADPALAAPTWERLRRVLIQQYGDALGLIDVG